MMLVVCNMKLDVQLETPFTASPTDVPNMTAHSYNVKVSLLKCVTHADFQCEGLRATPCLI